MNATLKELAVAVTTLAQTQVAHFQRLEEEAKEKKWQGVLAEFDRWDAERIEKKKNELQEAYEARSRGLVSRHDTRLIDQDIMNRKRALGDPDWANIDTTWNFLIGNYSEFERVHPTGLMAQHQKMDSRLNEMACPSSLRG